MFSSPNTAPEGGGVFIELCTLSREKSKALPENMSCFRTGLPLRGVAPQHAFKAWGPTAATELIPGPGLTYPVYSLPQASLPH